MMARESERFMRLISEMAEVFGRIGDIFGPLEVIRPLVKCESEIEKCLKDVWFGFRRRPGLQEYGFSQMKDCLVEVILMIQ